MTLSLRLARQQAFSDVSGASRVMATLLAELASGLWRAPAWAGFGGARVRLDGEVLELLLAESRFLHGDRDDQPTHAVQLFRGPTGATMGIMSINIRTHMVPETAPGLAVSVSLPDDFESEAAELVCRVDAWAQAISADSAMLGPKELMQSLGVGVLTLTRRAPRDRLPPSARVIPGRSGDFILAHNEPLGSESATARAALVRVQRALDPSLPLEDPPAEAPTAQAAPPTPILPAGEEPESRWARWAGATPAAATVGLDDSAIRQAILPFLKGAPSPQFFAEADATRREVSERPAVPSGEQTLELGASLPLPATGSPAATLGLVPSPSMSLEQYAAFCAELAVFPGKTGDIHARYGVADAGALKALNEAFAWRFSVDRSQQERWQALVAHYGQWFRREAAK